jgi:antitoxin (DNA-binding transcriptional repressor) of toxin-antitoxin stability system
MEQVNATQAARQLSDLLNRVSSQGVSFELTRGGHRIARLVPAPSPKALKVSELNDLFARLPRLGDETEAFEREIADAQSALVLDRDPWQD